MASQLTNFAPSTPPSGALYVEQQLDAPPAPKKGRKRHLEAADYRVMEAREDDPAFMDGPDLGLYLEHWGLPVKDRVKLCRTYAAHLAVKAKLSPKEDEESY